MSKKSKAEAKNYPDIHEILSVSRVIPVVNIDDPGQAVPLAKALLEGGVGIIEVTLRTKAGVESIKRISQGVPDMCVGAGTVWTRKAAKQVRKAGAQFMVSPGRSDAVYKYCSKHQIALLPGVQTASEIAVWVERGYEAVKFFPAEVAGGVSALKAFSSVFGNLKFCPTGGISSESSQDYLSLPSVVCVGGSWLVSKKALAEGDWASITEAASRVHPESKPTTNSSDSSEKGPPWD